MNLTHLMILFSLLLSPSAFADRILAPGEMYTSRFAGERIACDGSGGSQPDRDDFITEERVAHDQAWQNHSEGNARSMCEGDGQAQVFFSATVQKLLRDANAQCLRYFSNCKQLGHTQGDFIPKHHNGGRYACYLRVTVRGTR